MSGNLHQHRHSHSHSRSHEHHCCDVTQKDDFGGQDFNEILEEMHPCCQKDAAERTRAAELREELDRVDPSKVSERARKEAFSTSGALSNAQLPQCRRGGRDYPALEEARRAAAAAKAPCWKGGNDSDERDGCLGEGDSHSHSHSDEDDEEDDEDLMYLLDDPELLRMEKARVEAMQTQAERLKSLRALGFGLHLEVQPSELETVVEGQFRGAGVVVHAYSADSPLCASLDLFLEGKAASYMGTRFVRCLVRPDSTVASKMCIRRVPSLGCYQGGVRVAYTEGLAQFGERDRVESGAVQRWLEASGTLEFDPPSLEALRHNNSGGSAGDDDAGDQETDGEGTWYDCGLEGCRKSFAHDHFLATGGEGRGLPPDFDKPF